MMSISSCVYCPFVCLLWRNVYLDLLPMNLVLLSMVELTDQTPLYDHIPSSLFMPSCLLSKTKVTKVTHTSSASSLELQPVWLPRAPRSV